MARHPRLDIQVAYCSLQGAEAGHDPEFEREVQWDVPLLDGYPWVHVPNRSLRPGLGRFFGLFNPGLWRLVRDGRFDAVEILTGYVYASFWIALAGAKSKKITVVFGTDASGLASRERKWWKRILKPLVVPRIFALADLVNVASRAGKGYVASQGVREERIVIQPLVVDNDWWSRQAAQANRTATRQEWKIPTDASVVLFCAKLQPWKRPGDLLLAFARAKVNDSYLVFAGDGPLKPALEEEAARLGVSERVRFLGFVNQSRLPCVYAAGDLFVLPSEYDPSPAVVCEAMLCGKPVLLSDQIPGRFDQVVHGETGFVFRCGDIQALAQALQELLADPARLAQMGETARERMRDWSPARNIEALVGAVEKAMSRKGIR
jgi:glycosyltransferase involved in cell wall biosynthesis